MMTDAEFEEFRRNARSQPIFKPLAGYTPGTLQSQKREILATTSPKIVDPKKYHGPAVTDFEAIARRMKELDGSQKERS